MATILKASEPDCVSEAVRLLKAGELVCYPTDTVYGLGAAATDDRAVLKLFAIKGRPLNKPLPLLIGDVADAHKYAQVSPVAQQLMAKFWPGGLTLVMRKSEGFVSLALAGAPTVGLRVPDHEFLLAALRALDQPITGTSANLSGARSSVSAVEVAFQLGDMVSLIVDGGTCRQGKESTVLDITVNPARIIREGVIDREAIEEVIGQPVAV